MLQTQSHIYTNVYQIKALLSLQYVCIAIYVCLCMSAHSIRVQMLLALQKPSTFACKFQILLSINEIKYTKNYVLKIS